MNLQDKVLKEEKIDSLELLLGGLSICLGFIMVIYYAAENDIPWIMYVINGVVYMITGVYRIRWALFKKSIYTGNFYCFPEKRGVYTKITNDVFWIIALMNTSILMFNRINQVGSVIFLVGLSIIFNCWTAYGVKYNRTKCLIVNENNIIVVNGRKEKKVNYDEIDYCIFSAKIGGYKAFDKAGEEVFEYAWAWDNSQRLGNELMKNGIKFMNKK